MIRWHCYVSLSGGRTMPEFTTVSIKEAQLRTIPGRQGAVINEYANYIQQLPTGQAGKLRIGDEEKHQTVRRRLVVAAKALGIPLIIKRSGTDLYFWREDGEEEQPRSKRSYTRRIRRGTPGSLILSDMLISEPEAGERGVPAEESPESGQLASEAERRVAQG
jgi:hypothetical protein